jgi:8-hydroxy-5-deazaflavin:NADPH oxidoreductase
MNSAVDIGFIGAGSVAQELAPLAVTAGHDVVISDIVEPVLSNDLAEQLGPGIEVASLDAAAELGIVVLAIPWSATGSVLDRLPNWNGRILVDATNHFLDYPNVADLGQSTASELIAEHAPGARVVKSFNTLDPGHRHRGLRPTGDGRRVIFVASDYLDAAESVRELSEAMGFFPIAFDTLRDGRLFQLGGPLNNGHFGHFP